MRPMVVSRGIIVTRVCTDYDSYLKIRPNQKKMGSNCQVRRALFALKTTTILEPSVCIPSCTIGH